MYIFRINLFANKEMKKQLYSILIYELSKDTTH